MAARRRVAAVPEARVNEALTLHVRPDRCSGSHITEIFLDGVPLDPAATYTVGANSFLASGGDNFTTFRAGMNKADTGKVDLEAMVDYFQTFGTAIARLRPARGRRRPA